MRGFKLSNPVLAVFLLLSVLFTLPVIAYGETTPRTVALEASVNLALAIMQNNELAKRRIGVSADKNCRDALYPQFNFTRMAKMSVGRKWGKFSPVQKERFLVVFRKLLENTYLGMIERYQGEQVKFTKEVEKSNSITRVDAVILSKGQKYDVSYRLGADGDKWKVYDIIIEGMSVTGNYRAQFKQLLRKRNPDIDGVIAKLQEKVQKQ